VLSLVEPLPPVEVNLPQALGRPLAGPVRTAAPLPPFDNSAMDGYAVAGPGEVFELVADVRAGDCRALTLVPGQATQIMTGAPLPAGTTAVVPLEDAAAVDGSTVTVRSAVRACQHNRRSGEDAAAGVHRLLVRRPANVSLIVTGAELTEPGRRLGPGGIFDSNSTLLSAACTAAGADATVLPPVADDPGLTAQAFHRASAGADLVVVAGGVSAGVSDCVRDVLSQLGGTLAHVALRPGRPQAYGQTAEGVPILAIPGNPVSAAVSFAVFVRPVLDRLAGAAPGEADTGRVRAASAWSSPAGLRQYVPVRLASGADLTGGWAEPVFPGAAGSHRVAALALADALAVVPESVTKVVSGDVLALVRLP
jgi:molybdopterin molybdotransferase